MSNMLRKGIKFSIQWVYFPQSYFESRHYGKRFNSIGKFKSLTFQLRAIYFHTFAVDMSVNHCTVHFLNHTATNLSWYNTNAQNKRCLVRATNLSVVLTSSSTDVFDHIKCDQILQ